MKSALAFTRLYMKLAMREKQVLFFNYLFPVAFLFFFAQIFGGNRNTATITFITTTVMTFGILGNGLFGSGMRAITERETDVLRRYRVAPITPLPLLCASLVAGLVLFLPSVAVILLISHFAYGMPIPGQLASLLVFVAVAVLAFRAIGLIIASVANSLGESVILTQLFFFPMFFLSGATLPMSMMPGWLRNLTPFVPSFHLANGLQGILQRDQSVWQNGTALLAMMVTLVLATFIAMKLFRWEKGDKVPRSALVWLLVILLPFVVIGVL